MAQKVRINGTAYDLKPSPVLINGTKYQIGGGRTLIDGTGYDISLQSGIPVTILAGEKLTMNQVHESYLTTASTAYSWIVADGVKIETPTTLTIGRGNALVGVLTDSGSQYAHARIRLNGVPVAEFSAGISGVNIDLWDYIPNDASAVTLRCAQFDTPMGRNSRIDITTL